MLLYTPPLRLEEADDGTFLETSFDIAHGVMRYRLKNVNAGGEKKMWRYHSFDSYTTTEQKRSTMLATLKKVDFMASDEIERFYSAVDKLREFEALGYPATMRRGVCGVVPCLFCCAFVSRPCGARAIALARTV